MNEERLLIVGADGQLGKALCQRFPKAKQTNRQSLDITDKAALEAYDWSEIDTIINAAAYTNVDAAETSEGRVAAWEVNGRAVSYLAAIATARKITLLHVSSEYVFDGTHTLHTEEEPVSPLGVYGQSKAAGDLIVSTIPQHYVLRTTWLIGEGKNFVRTMMSLAEKNISPTVVDDQIGRLTFAETLVDSIETLLRVKAPYGIYNVSNDGEPASWAAVTREIFAILKRADLSVTPITTAEYFKNKPEVAPRPLQSALDLTKIQSVGVRPTDWRQELVRYVETQADK